MLALNYLHSQQIIHRDLTSQNILFSHDDVESYEIKIKEVGLFNENTSGK
jgi:serine/threonine protein kinase